MRKHLFSFAILLATFLPAIFFVSPALGVVSEHAAEVAANNETGIPAQLGDVGIQEHLGNKVSIESLRFKDETGRSVQLKDYFSENKPVLLTMVYYGCPNLCTFVLNGLVDSLKKMEWVPGKQFEVVAVSIDPTEGPELAARKKQVYLESYGKPETAAGWHFLTGDETQSKKLASEIGYSYKKEGDQYAHTAALYVLTPDGKISRYLYGIEYKPTDMKLALLEASNGKIGTVVDRLLLFCFRYDAATRKYSLYVTRVLKTSAAGTVVFFGAYLSVFWRRERRAKPEKETG